MTNEERLLPGLEVRPRNDSSELMAGIMKAMFDPNFDANKLAVLLDVKLKWDAEEARKAYIEAMQAFKKNVPVIMKTKHVVAGQMEYDHAELDKAAPLLADALLAVGITHGWRTFEKDGKIGCTCVLTHIQGHSQDAATLVGPPDSSGGKNAIQAIGSTTSYLERYSFFAACGIAPKGVDNDGAIEGMGINAVEEYCMKMCDCKDFSSLHAAFREGWEKAKSLKDKNSQTKLQQVYEKCKKDKWKDRK